MRKIKYESCVHANIRQKIQTPNIKKEKYTKIDIFLFEFHP